MLCSSSPDPPWSSCAPLVTLTHLWSQGTEIYDAKRGALVDLGILDVMQIFGRAGRPQFDKYGEGTIITTHDKLSYYLTLLTQQNPIESQFLGSLADNLNAEVSVQLFTQMWSGGAQTRMCSGPFYSMTSVNGSVIISSRAAVG